MRAARVATGPRASHDHPHRPAAVVDLLAEHLGRARRPALRGPRRRQRVQHVVEPGTRRQVAQRLRRRRASGPARRSAARRRGPSSSARTRRRAPACAATPPDAPRRRGRAAPRASHSRIFGPMWNVCRLIARPVSLRATANASSGVRRGEHRPRRGGEHRRPRAAQPACARDVAGPRRRAGGQPERDVDADRRAARRRLQHVGGRARPPTTSTRPPATRATTQPPGTPSTPAITAGMGQDGDPCASTSAPTTPASSSRPT